MSDLLALLKTLPQYGAGYAALASLLGIALRAVYTLYRERNEDLRSQIRSLEREATEIRRENSALRKENDRLRKDLAKSLRPPKKPRGGRRDE